jgi:hypothetical protein
MLNVKLTILIVAIVVVLAVVFFFLITSRLPADFIDPHGQHILHQNQYIISPYAEYGFNELCLPLGRLTTSLIIAFDY